MAPFVHPEKACQPPDKPREVAFEEDKELAVGGDHYNRLAFQNPLDQPDGRLVGVHAKPVGDPITRPLSVLALVVQVADLGLNEAGCEQAHTDSMFGHLGAKRSRKSANRML